MGRWIDWAKKPKTEWEMNEKSFPMKYGEGELRTLAHPETLYKFEYRLWPQFDLKPIKTNGSYEPFADGVVNWLGKNCASPWYYREGWTNHGHSVDFDVYIECEPDKVKFRNSEFGACLDEIAIDIFTPMATYDQAVILGFVKPETEKESPIFWTHFQNSKAFNIEWKSGDEKFNETYATIKFSNEDLEKKFIKDCVEKKWNDIQFKKDDEHIYSGKDGKYPNYLSKWFSKNFLDLNLSQNMLDSNEEMLRITLHHDPLIEVFSNTWGHIYKENGKGIFEGPLVDVPKKPIPQSFHDYIAGKITKEEALKLVP